MSNVHTWLGAFDRPKPASARLHQAAIESLSVAVTKRAANLIARFHHRRTMRRIERFSDRLLRDIGFERHWDGTVVPPHQ